ncbi:MAG: peptide-methionine (S)-S-oxide reductase MsrA [Fibrobacteria bacterium]
MVKSAKHPKDTSARGFCNTGLVALGVLGLWIGLRAASPPASADDGKAAATPSAGMAQATFAGGCFWCMESPFFKLKGVIDVIPGYTGGTVADPTYEDVSGGGTGHAECVNVTYDPAKVSYATLLEAYWRSADPTDAGGQFADRGTQYRPAIFYRNQEQKRLAEASKARLAAAKKFAKPIVTEITAIKVFYPAEEYHQHYDKKNPLRYHAYRKGSGRDSFIEKNFGIAVPEAPVIPVSKENDGVEDEAMTTSPESVKPEKTSSH